MFQACLIATIILFICNKTINEEFIPGEWRAVEELAEEWPFIVALLNLNKEYVCTGTVLDKRTVLTSGGCVTLEPKYVVVGAAVLGQFINNNNILEVAFTKLHPDYLFDAQESGPNIAQMHSNIGLVLTERPVLEFYIDGASFGHYYASELKEKKMIMIGYGDLKMSNAIVLQHQAYHQIACINPKWYYCICGLEYADISYVEPFGEGAPVFYMDDVVGVAVSPSGSLGLRASIIYNVFTVVGPYTSWIEKCKSDSILNIKTKLTNGVHKIFQLNTLYFLCILFIKLITY